MISNTAVAVSLEAPTKITTEEQNKPIKQYSHVNNCTTCENYL